MDEIDEKKPKLLLLPNVLADVKYHHLFLPAAVDKAVATLDGLIAESAGGGRRFLGRFQTKKPAIDIPLALLNTHTQDHEIDFLLAPILKGERWGLISDAGLPCIADPGSKLVQRAKTVGIAVQAFVGPSSIFLSLMLSGLPGQRFNFLGYLGKEEKTRGSDIVKVEQRSKIDLSTQIFIESPHRNAHTLQTLLQRLNDATRLCVAWDLTLPTQGVVSQTIGQWKKSQSPNLDKKAAIYLVFSGGITQE